MQSRSNNNNRLITVSEDNAVQALELYSHHQCTFNEIQINIKPKDTLARVYNFFLTSLQLFHHNE